MHNRHGLVLTASPSPVVTHRPSMYSTVLNNSPDLLQGSWLRTTSVPLHQPAPTSNALHLPVPASPYIATAQSTQYIDLRFVSLPSVTVGLRAITDAVLLADLKPIQLQAETRHSPDHCCCHPSPTRCLPMNCSSTQGSFHSPCGTAEQPQLVPRGPWPCLLRPWQHSKYLCYLTTMFC